MIEGELLWGECLEYLSCMPGERMDSGLYGLVDTCRLLDRDGDGAIDDGRELFGSGTLLKSGRHASNGFEALAELDGDRDGLVGTTDPRWGELLVWRFAGQLRRRALGDADALGNARTGHRRVPGLPVIAAVVPSVLVDVVVPADERALLLDRRHSKAAPVERELGHLTSRARTPPRRVGTVGRRRLQERGV